MFCMIQISNFFLRDNIIVSPLERKYKNTIPTNSKCIIQSHTDYSREIATPVEEYGKMQREWYQLTANKLNPTLPTYNPEVR